MAIELLSQAALERARSLRDLTDPNQGRHALQLLVEDAEIALRNRWRCPAIVWRGDPVVSVRDNYDALAYPAEGVARDARYTRYVTGDRVLRTHTTAMVPGLLREIAASPPADVLLLVPGMVYRRDCIDRWHTGEPHQLDLWRLRRGRPLGTESLDAMVETVVETLLPGVRYRTTATRHPYTTSSLQIDVWSSERWVEIGECGLAAPGVLARAGLPTSEVTGLAMGLGLDRLLMLRKGIDDIRLLRSADPRVADQMRDLRPYRPVSRQPATHRDLSIAVDAEATSEGLGDRVREVMGERSRDVESIEIVSETPEHALPEVARQRIGLSPGQKNVLLRVVLRSLDRSIGRQEANELRDRIYRALHEGTAHQWARGAPEARPSPQIS